MKAKTETYEKVRCPKCGQFTGVATVTDTERDGKVRIMRLCRHNRCDWYKKEEVKE